MQTRIKQILTYSHLIVWLVVCIALFVYVSRFDYVPLVNAANWQAAKEMLAHISLSFYILELLGALLKTALFSLSCLSLGLAILGKWDHAQPAWVAIGVTAFIIGEITYSAFFLVSISLYRLTPIIVSAILLFGFVIGLPALKIFISQPSLHIKRFKEFSSQERILFFLAGIAIVLGLSMTSVRLGYDATADYFSHAKFMAVLQLPIIFHPNHSFIVSEFHPGILFTAIIQVFGDQSARMLPWVNGVAILIMGLEIIGELKLQPRSSLWFLILMLTSTAFTDLLGDGKVELISTAPIITTIYWMLRSLDKPTRWYFTLVGLLSGFAIISRPYNIFLVPIFGALFYASHILSQSKDRRFYYKTFAQSALWALLPILILGIFHLFENFIFLGDPFAPLTFAKNIQKDNWQWQVDPVNLNIYRLLYPLTVTFLNSPQSLGNISPLLVGFLPFMLVKGFRESLLVPRRLGQITLVAFTTLSLWLILFFTVLEIRYILFLWVILFIFVAQIIETVLQKTNNFIQPFLYPLMTILIITMIARTSLIALIAYFPVDKVEQGKAFCPDNKLCLFLEKINQTAPYGDRVLSLHAYRYYLRPDLFACSSQVDEYYALEPFLHQDTSSFWVEVYRRGFHFITYEKHLSESRYQFGEIPNPDTAPDWMDVKTLFISSNGSQIIYQIKVVNPPILPDFFCAKTADGTWQVQHTNNK